MKTYDRGLVIRFVRVFWLAGPYVPLPSLGEFVGGNKVVLPFGSCIVTDGSWHALSGASALNLNYKQKN